MIYQRRAAHASFLIEKLLAKKKDLGTMSHVLDKVQFEIQANEIELLNKVRERKEKLVAEIEGLYT